MAIFSTGGTSFPDLLIGVILVSFSLIAILLNPVVFIYNNSKPRSIPKFLFQVLTAADFFTGAIMGLYIASKALQLEDEPNMTVPTVPQQVYGVTSWFLSQTPGLVGSVMAVCRYLQIRQPFRKISRRLIIWIVGGASVFNLAFLCWLLLRDGVLFNSTYYNLWPESRDIFHPTAPFSRSMEIYNPRTYFTLNWTATLGQPVSIFVSALTIRHLYITYKNPVAVHSQRNGRRSSIKILLLNLGSLLQNVWYLITIPFFLIDDLRTDNAQSLNGFLAGVFPVFLSSLNPVLFLALTPALRSWFLLRATVVIRRIKSDVAGFVVLVVLSNNTVLIPFLSLIPFPLFLSLSEAGHLS